ncbi:MAG: redoxin domain-containing protein [Alphaproteobacteria bacterium]|nr:MAG: redoxin domain-containing protein [Alphaproteobacteria bacterium]
MASKNQTAIIGIIAVICVLAAGMFLKQRMDSGEQKKQQIAVEQRKEDFRAEMEEARKEREARIAKRREERKNAPPFRPDTTREIVFGNMDDGKDYPMSSFKGKLLVVNLWGMWCKPCIKELPRFMEAQKFFTGAPVTFVAVSMDNTGQAPLRAFLKRNKIQLTPLYMDTQRSIRHRENMMALPVTWIIGPDGKLLRRIEQPADWSSKESQQFILFYLKQTGLLKK